MLRTRRRSNHWLPHLIFQTFGRLLSPSDSFAFPCGAKGRRLETVMAPKLWSGRMKIEKANTELTCAGCPFVLGISLKYEYTWFFRLQPDPKSLYRDAPFAFHTIELILEPMADEKLIRILRLVRQSPFPAQNTPFSQWSAIFGN